MYASSATAPLPNLALELPALFIHLENAQGGGAPDRLLFTQLKFGLSFSTKPVTTANHRPANKTTSTTADTTRTFTTPRYTLSLPIHPTTEKRNSATFTVTSEATIWAPQLHASVLQAPPVFRSG